MTRAPVSLFADHFDIPSEIKEPAKPMTAENMSNACRSRPVPRSLSNESIPSRFMTTPSIASTATLVATNKKMRFIESPEPFYAFR